MQGFEWGNGVSDKVALYADYIPIFLMDREVTGLRVLQILKLFGKTSGLYLNMAKSLAFPANSYALDLRWTNDLQVVHWFLMTEDGFPDGVSRKTGKTRGTKRPVPGLSDGLLLPASLRNVFGNPDGRIPDIFNLMLAGIGRAAFRSRFCVGCSQGVRFLATLTFS
ncbi:hypothetical protein NDU88_005020 [Pleurodeles waltl]|uniref:Reverse transcriptase n=1 Tax=Pleurodeles waltl TaxID=8319 RepID=A0AAV7N4N6_PLEWA|nr:hypothetical protein NDU88_005020 [Pleurodeles waltl]